MRLPNLKGMPQADYKIQDASTTAAMTSTPTPLLPFVAAETTAAINEVPHRAPLRFGAIGRRPQRNAIAPTIASRAAIPLMPESTQVPSPEIDALEERQVQASNICPSGLEYIQCADGSFQGCGNKNICAINATTSSEATQSSSGTATRTTVAPTSTSGRMTTAVRSSSTSQPSTTMDTVPTASATTSPSSKSSVGGIAGGSVGGVAALVIIFFLIGFFVRRHRRTVEKRRASALLPKSYRDEPSSRHQRSMSTANDVFTFGASGKAGAGVASDTEMQALNAKNVADQRFWHSASVESPPPFAATPAQQFPSPGLRAEGGPGLPPAAFLRPIQMLDGREIHMMGEGRPRSVASGSRFREEGLAVEMEDTSSASIRRPVSFRNAPSPTLGESPVLGQNPLFNPTPSSGLSEDVRRREHHLMSWSTYDSGMGHPGGGENFEMTATMTPRPPPSARSSPSMASPSVSVAKVSPLPLSSAQSPSPGSSPPLSAAQISPLPPSQQSSPSLHGGEILGSGVYVVSPMRKQRFEK